MEKYIIGGAAGWELLAFWSRGHLPTLSALLRKLPPRRRAAVIVYLLGWIIIHLDLLSPEMVREYLRLVSTHPLRRY